MTCGRVENRVSVTLASGDRGAAMEALANNWADLAAVAHWEHLIPVEPGVVVGVSGPNGAGKGHQTA